MSCNSTLVILNKIVSKISILFIFFVISLDASALKKDIKTVVITGGTYGIGKEVALIFSHAGWNVWVTTRSQKEAMSNESDANIKVISLDLTNDNDVRLAIDKIYKDSSRIDVLVNNAGYGLLGTGESLTLDQIKDQFDVNLYGSIRMIQSVLPIMRKQYSGRIINVSSTSGIRAVPGLGAYAASKMALEGFSEALIAELHPWNIHVSLIQPGTVKNDWVNNCVYGLNIVDDKYTLLSTTLKNTLVQRAKNGQEQVEVGKLVLEAATSEKPHFRYQTSDQAVGIAKEIYVDPQGDFMKEKMIEFAKTLYKG